MPILRVWLEKLSFLFGLYSSLPIHTEGTGCAPLPLNQYGLSSFQSLKGLSDSFGMSSRGQNLDSSIQSQQIHLVNPSRKIPKRKIP